MANVGCTGSYPARGRASLWMHRLYSLELTKALLQLGEKNATSFQLQLMTRQVHEWMLSVHAPVLPQIDIVLIEWHHDTITKNDR